jgi:hypothetical protein
LEVIYMFIYFELGKCKLKFILFSASVCFGP